MGGNFRGNIELVTTIIKVAKLYLTRNPKRTKGISHTRSEVSKHHTRSGQNAELWFQHFGVSSRKVKRLKNPEVMISTAESQISTCNVLESGTQGMLSRFILWTDAVEWEGERMENLVNQSLRVGPMLYRSFRRLSVRNLVSCTNYQDSTYLLPIP